MDPSWTWAQFCGVQSRLWGDARPWSLDMGILGEMSDVSGNPWDGQWGARYGTAGWLLSGGGPGWDRGRVWEE